MGIIERLVDERTSLGAKALAIFVSIALIASAISIPAIAFGTHSFGSDADKPLIEVSADNVETEMETVADVPEPTPEPEPEVEATVEVVEDTPEAEEAATEDEATEETPQVVKDFIAAVDALAALGELTQDNAAQYIELGQKAMDAYEAVQNANLEDYEGVEEALMTLMELSDAITGGAEMLAMTPHTVQVKAEVKFNDVVLVAKKTVTISCVNESSHDPKNKKAVHAYKMQDVIDNAGVPEGYEIIAWSKDGVTSEDKGYVQNGILLQNASVITLYAAEAKAVYNVTYDANGTDVGGMPQNVSTTEPAAFKLATNKPSRYGYTFLGWSTDPNNAENPIPGGSSYELTSQETTFYALWEARTPATITYDGNGAGGTIPNPIEAYVGDTVKLADKGKMTNPGYRFTGWNTLADGAGASYDGAIEVTIDAEATTLYAQWEEHDHGVDDFMEIETIWPTCETDGYAVKQCAVCDYVYEDHDITDRDDLKSHGHDYRWQGQAEGQEATCLDAGYAYYKCSNYNLIADVWVECGSSYTVQDPENFPPTGHNWSSYEDDATDPYHPQSTEDPLDNACKSTQHLVKCTNPGCDAVQTSAHVASHTENWDEAWWPIGSDDLNNYEDRTCYLCNHHEIRAIPKNFNTIVWTFDDGTTETTQVEEGTEFERVQGPALNRVDEDGSTFVGNWVVAEQDAAGNIVCKPNWTLQKTVEWYDENGQFYSIIYDDDPTGENPPAITWMNPQSGNADQTFANPELEARTGYRFGGWITTMVNPSYEKRTMNWIKLITIAWYNGFGGQSEHGSLLKSLEGMDFGTEPGQSIYPANPTRPNFNFAGWQKIVDEEGNISFKALWTAIPPQDTSNDTNGFIVDVTPAPTRTVRATTRALTAAADVVTTAAEAPEFIADDPNPLASAIHTKAVEDAIEDAENPLAAPERNPLAQWLVIGSMAVLACGIGIGAWQIAGARKRAAGSGEQK